MQVARIGYDESRGFFDPEDALAEMTDEFAKLVEGRPIAMLDWPEYKNAGDHFIWLGEKIVFRDILKRDVIYECSIRSIDFQRLSRLPVKTVFILQGGGNFGDLYPSHQRFREAIIAAFPDRRIIAMPQSTFFQSRSSIVRARRIFRGHPDLHVFARDRNSLAFIKHNVTSRNVLLGIDSAFYLGKFVRELAQKLPPASVATVRLLRSDVEVGLSSEKIRSEGEVKDWSNPDDLDPGTDNNLFHLRYSGIDLGNAFGGDLDSQSWRRLCGAVSLFATASEIVTDRLHGHILCVMMGKPHVVFDNSYSKNKSFYDTWEAPVTKSILARVLQMILRH